MSYFAFLTGWNTLEEIRPVTGLKTKINEFLYVVKVQGTYNEMGRQYGETLKDVLAQEVEKSVAFMQQNQSTFLKSVPEEYKRATFLASIRALYDDNLPHYNRDVIDFMKGVAMGSGVLYEKLVYCNFFSDLMDNHHCILLNKNINGKQLNLRTLDFGTNNIKQVLTVFHPVGKTPYVSLGLVHFFGVVSGMSKKNIFFGESYHDVKLGTAKVPYKGTPFHHVAHEVLSTANSLSEAAEILKGSARMSNLEFLVADDHAAKILLASVDVFDEIPQSGAALFSVTPVEKKNFDENFHYLTDIKTIIKEFVPRTKSGDLHVIITYNDKIYISVTTDVLHSYNNTFYEFDLPQLFIKHK
jgi:hypothetical protein